MPPSPASAPSAAAATRRTAAAVAGRVRPAPGSVALALGVVLHAVVYARLCLQRQDAFWQARFDLGNMTQAVWSTAHGEPLSTTSTSGDQISRLAAHVDPLLGLLAPLWWVWPSADMLLVVQAVVVASGAVPLYLVGRHWLGDDRIALAGPAAYLLSPAMGWATVTEFHPVTLAGPLVLWAVWAADARRDVALAVFAGLALLGKENVGLTLAVVGVWVAFGLGRRRAGLVLAAVSLAWTALAVAVITPLANAGRPSPLVAGRYGELGDSPREILQTLVTRPDVAVETVLAADRLEYVLALALPLAGLFLLAPLLAAAALPDLLLNVLSARPEQHQLEYHYVALLAPVLSLAAVRGLSRLVHPGRRRRLPAVAGAATLVTASVIGAWALGPLPLWAHVGGRDWRNNEYVVDAHARVLGRAVALIPTDGDVPVSATNHAGAHLSARHRIYTFPVVRDAEWVLVDRRRPETIVNLDEADLASALRALAARPDMRRVFQEDGVSVFRRVGTSSTASTIRSTSRRPTRATGTPANDSVSAR